jgi:hypothetical protein
MMTMKHALNIILIIISITLWIASGVLHMFSIWQGDLINVNPVWQTRSFIRDYLQGLGIPSSTTLNQLYELNLPPYSAQYFQCAWWHTTIGQAYDTLLLYGHISFWMGLAAFWLMFIALWTWND